MERKRENGLVPVIAASLAEWEVPHVELAIFGSADPAHIAREIEGLCVATLRSPPREALFYQSSIGAVAGLRLENGQRVVVKSHPPATTHAHLREVLRLQSIVGSKIGLAPRVLAGPELLGRGFAAIEELVDRGSIRDGHDEAARNGLAQSLHAIVDCLLAEYESSDLPFSLLFDWPRGRLWPQPHSKLFDFEATIEGAQYIDEVAAKALEHMVPAGRTVIGHGDWRAEHVRFEGNIPVVAFDWDSLCKTREPALVGSAAHMFCSDWSREGHVQAPTMEEARAFVAAYEAARGGTFSREERELCGAAFAYAVAYTCRCGHSAGVDARDQPGNFQHLLAGARDDLFRL
jgi:hypothetical protein